MRSASRKPRVVTSSVGSPLRSSSALVATVVPIFTHSTCCGVTGSPRLRPSRWRMPATAASLYCSGFSLSSLCVASVPSGFLATMSVKVPPRSIQNCQRVAVAGELVAFMCFCRSAHCVERNEHLVGRIADRGHPFPGEFLAHPLQVAAQLERDGIHLDAIFPQIVGRVHRRCPAEREAARLARRR